MYLQQSSSLVRKLSYKQTTVHSCCSFIVRPLTITHGVPQGSILGPALFSLYMNDLPEVIKFSNIESYVDDTKIYFSFASKNIDSCLRQVDEYLKHVSEWCWANHLLINPDKTKFVLFGVRQLISKLPSNITVPWSRPSTFNFRQGPWRHT